MHMPSGTISYFQYRQTFLQARRLPALALSAWVVKVLITMRVSASRTRLMVTSRG